MKIAKYLFCIILFVSCNQSDTSLNNNKNNSVVVKKNKVQGNLLFGCKRLLNLSDLNGKTKTSYNYSLEVFRYYGKLITNKTLQKPNIREIEYINLKYHRPFIDSLTHKIDSIKCYIGKMGPYRAYFSLINFDNIKFPAQLPDTSLVCSSAGNLILYNPVTQQAKVITVHYNASGSFEEDNRFFYVNRNNEIHVFYENAEDEISSSFFQKEYLIKISDAGIISIKRFKI